MRLQPPVCVGATLQTEGKGSRGNRWIGEQGNLFLSLAITRSDLPADLKIESSSIYAAFLMKELLASRGSAVWLKWPNDFYLGRKKMGGVITNLVGENVVFGIGINLASSPEGYAKSDVRIAPEDVARHYCTLFENLPSWKQIFSKYQLEFDNSRTFFTHYKDEKVAMSEAVLQEDGSLMCDGQRIFSLR